MGQNLNVTPNNNLEISFKIIPGIEIRLPSLLLFSLPFKTPAMLTALLSSGTSPAIPELLSKRSKLLTATSFSIPDDYMRSWWLRSICVTSAPLLFLSRGSFFSIIFIINCIIYQIIINLSCFFLQEERNVFPTLWGYGLHHAIPASQDIYFPSQWNNRLALFSSPYFEWFPDLSFVILDSLLFTLFIQLPSFIPP